MDFSVIASAIGSLGFPIVCCCAMFWLNYKNEERRAAEMNEITAALNNNTKAMIKLSERLNIDSNEVIEHGVVK